MKLYEITNEFKFLEDYISDNESSSGNIDSLLETLDSLKNEFQEKAVNVAAYVMKLEAEAETMRDYEKNMAIRRRRREAASASLKDYLKRNMEAVGQKGIASVEFDIVLRKNPPKVVIDNENTISLEYQKIEYTIDKQKIREELLKGTLVDGARLEQDLSVNIKRG